MVEREVPFSATNRYLYVKWILTSTGTCLLIADLDSSRYKQNFKHSFVFFQSICEKESPCAEDEICIPDYEDDTNHFCKCIGLGKAPRHIWINPKTYSSFTFSQLGLKTKLKRYLKLVKKTSDLQGSEVLTPCHCTVGAVVLLLWHRYKTTVRARNSFSIYRYQCKGHQSFN